MLIRSKTVFVYDIETFPNFFSVAVKNTESGNIRTYLICDWQNDMPEIAKLFLNKNICFCGYNNIHYDDPIINYILINYNDLIRKPIWEITRSIKDLSNVIIDSGNQFNSWSKYKYAHIFDSLDLLAMMFSNKIRTGLKELQVTMNYKNVEEYDGDFESSISREDAETVIKYNINDVESTEELLNRKVKDIELRLSIEDEFHISALNKDGVNLGMEILKKRYLDETGRTWSEIKDLRSPCDAADLNEVIFDYIEFNTPILQDLLKELKTLTIDPKDKDFERKFVLGGLEHTVALGGIHSVSGIEKFLPGKDSILRDDDVASLYPSIMIENGLYPAHLGPEFAKVYKGLKDDRIKAKRAGDKLKNETYKLAINGLTGNLQSEYSWVYDPLTVLKIRINGQLLLLMYVEKLIAVGAKLINTNTDGVFFEIEKDKESDVEEIRKWWQDKTHLELETDYFERFYQWAINDYVGVKKGWSETHDPKLIKKKGMFLTEPVLGKGLAPLIVPEAICNYFVEGIDPIKTIQDCKDILKFCTYQKVDKKFEVLYGREKTRHINRYYMSTNGKPLEKYDSTKNKYIALCASSNVTIYNTFDDKPIEDRHINYAYYRNEAMKIIEQLDKTQLSLF